MDALQMVAKFYQYNGERVAKERCERDRARKQKAKAYFDLHRDDQRQRCRDYMVAHPEAGRIGCSKSYLAKYGAVVKGFDYKTWFLSYPRPFICYLCGAKIIGRAFHIEHKTPLCREGKHCAENLGIACIPCNQSKHRKTVSEFLQYKERKMGRSPKAQNVVWCG